MSEKHIEAFRAKNERRRLAKNQTMGMSKADLKLGKEIRRGLSGKFGREKAELTSRALPGTYKEV